MAALRDRLLPSMMLLVSMPVQISACVSRWHDGRVHVQDRPFMHSLSSAAPAEVVSELSVQLLMEGKGCEVGEPIARYVQGMFKQGWNTLS